MKKVMGNPGFFANNGLILAGLLAAMSLAFFTGGLGASTPDDQGEGLYFYLPTMEELQQQFQFQEGLRIRDQQTVEWDAIQVLETYGRYVGRRHHLSLLFESYLMGTENQGLREILLQAVRDGELKDDFALALAQLYEQGPSHLQENEPGFVNLFLFRPMSFFDGELYHGLLENEWGLIQRADSNDPERSNVMIAQAGGDTLALSMNLRRYPGMEYGQFRTHVVEQSQAMDFPNGRIHDLEHFYESAASDSTTVAIGFGPAERFGAPRLIQGSLELFLYDEAGSTGYRVNYTLFISPANALFGQATRILNRLLFHLVTQTALIRS